MDDETARRLEDVEATVFAQGLALRHILKRAIPSPAQNAALRDEILEMLENLYPRDKVTEHGHPFVQKAIAQIEAMFDRLPPIGPTA